MRWEAIAALRARGRLPDLRALALQRLAAGTVTPSAVRILDDAGKPEDWEALFPALDAAAPLARAAIVLMKRLDRSASRETRLMMVGDGRPGVARTAARSLRGEIWSADRGVLEEHLRSPDVAVQQAAAELVAQLGSRSKAARG